MSSFVIKSIGNLLNATSLVSSKYATKKALNLFATPRQGRYSETQKEVISSALFQTLKYNNLDIATYRWNGKNKTILLVEDRIKTGATVNLAVSLLKDAAVVKTFAVNGNADYELYNESCFRFPWIV